MDIHDDKARTSDENFRPKQRFDEGLTRRYEASEWKSELEELYPRAP